jgi:hypothetical protein
MLYTKLRIDSLRMLAVVISFCVSAGMASAAAAKYHVIYRFPGGGNGAYPSAGLVADKSGNLYGTTNRGGRESGLCQANWGCGTVFQLKPSTTRGGAWTESVIYKFGPFAHPAASLIMDQAGNLYGTTPFAGKSNNGTVFELKRPTSPGRAWTYGTLYSFTGGSDGSAPASSLVFDKAGNIYGTTQFGGDESCSSDQGSGCGTVFQLSPPAKSGGTWRETVLYRFIPANDYPLAGLIVDSQGNLYGTTAGDQSASFGTVFQLAPPAKRDGSWTQTTIFSFGFVKNDGNTPAGGLILDKKGNLYGTTSAGGSDHSAQCLGIPYVGYGTVFELERPVGAGVVWKEHVLYAFKHGRDGACPLAALVADSGGKLYGTAAQGGSESGVCAMIDGCGTLFQLTPPPALQGGIWTEITLREFEAGLDGLQPLSTPIFGEGGRLFGTTAGGGGTCAFPIPCGIVFSRAP